MAVQKRTIKRRIKSVTNTRKITKAMELVAASKMRKSVNAVLLSRPYSKLAWETVMSIGERIDTTLHPLLRERSDISRVLVLLVSSDRGLAGGYNANVVKTAMQEIRRLGSTVEIQTICIGKRGADAMRRNKLDILASFTEVTNNTKFQEVLPIGRMVIQEFTSGNVDQVLLVYTDFISALSQKPVIVHLLPLSRGSLKERPVSYSAYTFEPSARDVLDRILPRLIETMVYQAVLEAAASEHASRMIAMRSASDAASEMIDDLTFTFNQARQAGITQEIAEISSGKAALEAK